MSLNKQMAKLLNLMENKYFVFSSFDKLKDTKSALEVDFKIKVKWDLFNLQNWTPTALYLPIWIIVKNSSLSNQETYEMLFKENELEVSWGKVFDINYNANKESLYKAYTTWDYDNILSWKDKIFFVLLEVEKFYEIKHLL